MNKGASVFVRKLTVVAALSLVSGCASLTNPYIDMADHSVATDANGKKLTEPQLKAHYSDVCARQDLSMQRAIECAEVIRSRYLKRMGNQANLTAWTGIGLIPLTAYTTYLAIDGGHASSVTSLALTGAAAFALSSWLSQPERTQIYGLGQTAIQCAISASQPFLLDSEARNTINTNIEDLRQKSAITATGVARMDAIVSGFGKGRMPIRAGP